MMKLPFYLKKDFKLQKAFAGISKSEDDNIKEKSTSVRSIINDN